MRHLVLQGCVLTIIALFPASVLAWDQYPFDVARAERNISRALENEEAALKKGVTTTNEFSEIPVINLRCWLEHEAPACDSSAKDRIIEKIGSAASTGGAFQITGFKHSSLDIAKTTFNDFFNLDRKTKSFARSATAYGSWQEVNKLGYDSREFMCFGPRDDNSIHLQDLPNTIFTAKNMAPRMEQHVHDAHAELLTLDILLHHLLALAVGLDKHAFLSATDHYAAALCFASYDSEPQIKSSGSSQRMRGHVDQSTFTILDSNLPGLQIVLNDTWQKLPLRANHYNVLIAGGLEGLTDGIFKAAPHRVVTEPNGVRSSVAYFAKHLQGDADPHPFSPLIERENRTCRTAGLST